MTHIAIMNKSWKLIPKIISGEKTIESRWYKTKRTPWDKIKSGDTVYFKNAGETVTAVAHVANVLQFSLKNLTDTKRLIKTYGKDIGLINTDPATWSRQPNYCILVFLTDAQALKKSFAINKKGFGIGAAWLTVSSIREIQL